jgi:hypothetical protein
MSRLLMLILAYWFAVASAFGQDAKLAAPTTDPAPAESAQPAAASQNPSNVQPAPVTPEQFEMWIKDLVDPKFAVRQAASGKLIEAGAAGMEAVAKAADSNDLELATRCLAVLSDGLITKDEASKKAARDALKHLVKSENKSVAQRALQALETPAGPLPRVIIPGPGNRQNRMLAGMAIGNNVKVQISTNQNGEREAKITENSKEILIKDTKGKQISVSITETINGMKKVTAATGKDPDDLKQNSPEANGYYEKYCSGNGIRVQIGGNVVAANGRVLAVPAVPPLRRFVNPIKAAGLFEEIETLRQKIDEANDRLQKAIAVEQPNVADLKKISDEIKAATKRLSEIKSESEAP